MPVKVSRKISRKKATNTKNSLVRFMIFAVVIGVVLLCLGLVKYIFRTHYWRGDNRLVLVIHEANDDVIVSSIDPVAKEIVNIRIPGSTEIEVADNLGKWRVGKLWKLGFQEDRAGELLMKSVTSSFGFPSMAWSDSSGGGLLYGGVKDLIKSVFAPYKTNLKIGDRLAIAYFSKNLDNIRKTTIDLAETNVLIKTTLEDGDTGYKLSGNSSAKLNSYFLDYYLVSAPTRIQVKNASKLPGEGSKVGKIIELMGGKVASIQNVDEDLDFYCRIVPSSDKRAYFISAVLGCKLTNEEDTNNFDLRIILGNKFTL